jgi:hypothetical protein
MQYGLDLLMRAQGKAQVGPVWRLEAPALSSTLGVRLARAPIGGNAVWSPRVVERIEVRGGTARIQVLAGSAVLLSLG